MEDRRDREDSQEREEVLGEGFFIASLTPADVLTLTALLMCVCSLLFIAKGRFYYGMAILLLAMLFDAFDGIVARKYGWEGPFGRYLDGFVDAFNYLGLPSVILWRLGLGESSLWYLHALVLFIFTALGLIRLSVFNMIGNIKVYGGLSYLGLPVFWSQFLTALLFILKHYSNPMTWQIAVDLSLLAMGFCFIVRRPFWKPKSLVLIVAVILAMAGTFIYWGSLGLSIG